MVPETVLEFQFENGIGFNLNFARCCLQI